jgi:PAS domain S-box-containing protein
MTVRPSGGPANAGSPEGSSSNGATLCHYPSGPIRGSLEASPHQVATGELSSPRDRRMTGENQPSFGEARGSAGRLDSDDPGGALLAFDDAGVILDASVRASESKYKTVVDNIQEGIMVVAAGRVLYCNSRVGEMLGYSSEELERLEFGARLHPDDRDDAMQRLAAMFEQDTPGTLFEVRLVTKNGDARTIGSHATVVEWQGEPAVIVFLEDITERKRAEADQEMRRDLVKILDEPDDASNLFARLIDRIRTSTQFDAVGIRLEDNTGDFPYIAQEGFPDDFLETENTLLARDEQGEVCRDPNGKVVLECTCGLVISGEATVTDCFTRGGSFWTNEAPSLMDLPQIDRPYLRPRGVCPLVGFASIAVVPIRNREKIVGVLHLADRRKGRLTPETVERLEGIAAHIGADLVRRSAEAALGESQQRYATLVNLSPDAIVVDAGGRYVFANPAAVRLFGARSPEDLAGVEMAGRIHPAFRDLVAERALQVAGGATSAPREIKILRLDGTAVDVEATAARIEFDGRPANQVVLRDISERKRAEDRQHELERQLREREKLESLGFLAGGIAHDFNNMLTAIIGYSDLILAGGNHFSDTTLADVGEIKDAAERAKDLTGQILAFSRRQPRETKILGLSLLMAELETLLRRTLGEHIDMVVDLPAEDCRVEMDPNQLTQVIMNLVVNARDAMPAGGTLTLQVDRLHPEDLGERFSAVLSAGDWAVLRVTDSGVGIDPATLAHIFEPFFTTKLPGAGTGLGLSTTYGIVTQNGGEILVRSEVGQGSTFEVYLPSVPAEPGAGDDRHVRRPEAGPAAAWRAAGRTILVVEDEPAVRKLATRLLTEEGYRVVVASDGPRALSLARDQSFKIDLLLTDVVLPGVLQGSEVAASLVRERPGLKVVFMSGYPRDFMLDSGRLDEGINYIDKPFTAESLLAKVRDALLQEGLIE